MSTHFRVTYATLSADNEELHAAYEDGLRLAKSWLGSVISPVVSGKPRTGGPLFTVTSPGDVSLALCQVHAATPADVADAVAAAGRRGAALGADALAERVAVLRAAADLISERSNELAALMSLEVGKNRLEALGDVEEAADLIRYYCQQVEDHDGFVAPMGSLTAAETNVSVLRPYGVWAVISPFNFPMALAAGPAGAALVAGNTVVLKPSPQGSFTAAKLYECFRDAGLDPDVLHVLPGGDETGAALVAHPEVGGLTFTGSYAVGMSIYRRSPPPTPSRSSARWAARTRRSSPRSPTSTWRRPGWRGPRSGCPGRSARRARGCTCSATCTTRSSRSSPSGPGPWWSATRRRARRTSGR